ncbi:MAG: NAD-binding protein [Candidatus Sericytochromatia bacterium]|nr:NAD-binding protein [Candidatus Sericytochromatia bacterium]
MRPEWLWRLAGPTRRAAWRRRWRLAQAEVLYLRRVWVEFRASLLFTGTVWGLSLGALHAGYPMAPGEHPMTWDRAAYYVLVMTAFEAALEFPPQAPWFVKVVFYGLPLLGLFVIIDAIVRFSKLVFERRAQVKDWQALVASTFREHVVVCGLGHVGYRTAEQLLESHVECVGIEVAESAFCRDLIARGVPVVVGDTRQPETLLAAGVARARAIVVATDNDVVNIETALVARELAPGIRTVVRLFDQRLARKVERLGEIDAAFSTSELAAPVFAASALSQRVLHSFRVGGLTLQTVELTVQATSALAGKRISEVQARLELTFLLVRHNDHVDWNPPSDTVLPAGTTAMVVATAEVVQALEALNATQAS